MKSKNSSCLENEVDFTRATLSIRRLSPPSTPDVSQKLLPRMEQLRRLNYVNKYVIDNCLLKCSSSFENSLLQFHLFEQGKVHQKLFEGGQSFKI
jgi:hypothetical protein